MLETLDTITPQLIGVSFSMMILFQASTFWTPTLDPFIDTLTQKCLSVVHTFHRLTIFGPKCSKLATWAIFMALPKRWSIHVSYDLSSY